MRMVRVILDDKEITESFIRFACLLRGIDRDRVQGGNAFMTLQNGTESAELAQVRIEMEVAE